jgi:hypothetical protein
MDSKVIRNTQDLIHLHWNLQRLLKNVMTFSPKQKCEPDFATFHNDMHLIHTLSISSQVCIFSTPMVMNNEFAHCFLA